MAGNVNSLTRRTFSRNSLFAAAALTGCSRPLASRSSGWLFVAGASEKGVAVADLSAFRRVTTIPLGVVPGQVLRTASKVFVTCPEARMLCELDPVNLRVAGRIAIPGRFVSAAVVPGGKAIAVLTDQPAALVVVDPVAGGISKRIALPHAPASMDLTETTAVVCTEASKETDAVLLVSLGLMSPGLMSPGQVSPGAGKVAGVASVDGRCGAIRYRPDGRTILAAVPEAKQIVTLDAETGGLLARLPLPFAPARFCFSEDNGGQMFVTGTGGDSIVIVNPYQNQVDQTIVAGSTPYGMAVGTVRNQSLLLVTNPGSGDLTIFDVETRGLAASVHVGGNPGEVLLTQDREYALVVARDSGDVAVIRLRTVLDRSVKTKPIFTLFATAANPQSAAIIPSSV